MASIFSRIVQGEIPCYKIAEDTDFICFLDVFPIARGHALVVPKQEIDYIFDLNDDLLAKMLVFARPIAKAIEKVVPCKRIGLAVIGLEVPHAHLHLVPINNISDIDFAQPKLKLSEQEFADILAEIKALL